MQLHALSTNNMKTLKGEKLGWRTGILNLLPAKLSGTEMCPDRTPECTRACCNLAGQARFANVQNKRLKRTLQFLANNKLFYSMVIADTYALYLDAIEHNMKVALRLNGTSDIMWPTVWKATAGIARAYEYTKNVNRVIRGLTTNRPEWYPHFTFSRSELNWRSCQQILDLGGNVAAAYSAKHFSSFPRQYMGYDCVDGDQHDLTFLHPPGHIIMLKEKMVPGREKDLVKQNFVIYHDLQDASLTNIMRRAS